jgi:four helix bundle protein
MVEQAPKLKNCRELLVWQKAMDLAEECYRLSGRLPKSETYGLISQIQRAAVSVPANIAEGYGRSHIGDYRHHISIANGSRNELETHLLLAVRLRYHSEEEIRTAMALAAEGGRMLWSMLQKLPGSRR